MTNKQKATNWVRGASRSLEMPPRAHMTSYWRSIVTVALYRVASEIFNVEKCRDVEIWVRGPIVFFLNPSKKAEIIHENW